MFMVTHMNGESDSGGGHSSSLVSGQVETGGGQRSVVGRTAVLKFGNERIRRIGQNGWHGTRCRAVDVSGTLANDKAKARQGKTKDM